MSSGHEVEDVIGRIQQAMADPVALRDGRQLGVGISVGSALYPEQGETADTLLQAADGAMYESKRQRREGHRDNQTTT
ncbi:diguanylate cyclase domain-containing protein [Aeromonas sp. A-5]|uniref:diguanylate cyclase domain-containing protein n=1 Tax=Aeromonas ichthyocola TaxID=3367746 RepID=UPI0038DD728D